MFLSKTRPNPVLVSFFLNPYGPLSFTSHYPSRSAFLVFRFIPFSLFVFYFSARFLSPFVFSFPRVLVLGGFIGQKGAGASLLPPYGIAWGVGLCCPATAPGWLASGRGWQGATPLTSHHQGAWGFESSAGHAACRN